jgi:hypothetical protein
MLGAKPQKPEHPRLNFQQKGASYIKYVVLSKRG